jgi:hypothetical protein
MGHLKHISQVSTAAVSKHLIAASVLPGPKKNHNVLGHGHKEQLCHNEMKVVLKLVANATKNNKFLAIM